MDMEFNMQSLLDKITEFLKTEGHTETIIGKEFTLGEFTCVPVIRLGTGFGTGFGEGLDNKQGRAGGGGAGAGIGIEPIGFLVTRNDSISFIPTTHSRGLAAAMEKAPDIIEKIFAQKGKYETSGS